MCEQNHVLVGAFFGGTVGRGQPFFGGMVGGAPLEGQQHIANICYPTLHVNPGVVGRGTYRSLVAGGNPGGWRLPAGPETCTAVMVTGGARWGRRTLLGQRLPVPRGPEPLTRADGLVSELIERVVAHWGSSTFSPLRGARR